MTCFEDQLKPSCIDLFLTNCSRQFPRYWGNTDRALRFSQDEYNRQKHETVFFRNYKKFDNSVFREPLNRELLKYDLTKIEYDKFQEIIVSLLNVYAPLKKKYPWANHASFMTKKLRTAIMQRTRLPNIFLKQLTVKQPRLHKIREKRNALAF